MVARTHPLLIETCSKCYFESPLFSYVLVCNLLTYTSGVPSPISPGIYYTLEYIKHVIHTHK